MDDVKAAWRDLQQSPGWALLREHAEREWGGAAFVGMIETLADKPQDSEALGKLRQAIAAKRAVERLFQVPAEQVAKLERLEAQTPQLGRRGPL